MAAKKSSDEGAALNLDSLMDALTNVVAVLILALLLVNLNVTQKLVELTEALEPVTPEELEQTKKELEETEKEIVEAEKMSEQVVTPANIQQETRNIALLQKQLQEAKKKNEEMLRAVEDLKALEAKLREERDAEKKKTLALQEEIKRLELLLDTTPRLEPIPPTVVTIPDSRPVPENARQYFAMVRGDRVHLIDPFTPAETAEKEAKNRRKELNGERADRPGGDVMVYDQQATLKMLSAFDFKPPEGQTFKVISIPHLKYLDLEITPDLQKGGTSLEDLSKPRNAFVDRLKKIAFDRKGVLIFLVAPDGYATYLKARELADQNRVPAGWEIDGSPSRRVRLETVEVRPTATPPPPPANQKKDDGPPKLERKLD